MDPRLDRPPRLAPSAGHPLLFLDVDGVFNPFAAASCPPGYKEYALFPGEESVRLAIQHGDWVRELQQVFVVVWATGWGEHANNLLAPLLGLRRLPLVGFPPAPFPSEAKVPAVASYAGPHPAAWIDDCHTEMGRQWANDRGAPTMLLACDPATGWTRQTVDELLAWVDELDPARPAARRPPGRSRRPAESERPDRQRRDASGESTS